MTAHEDWKQLLSDTRKFFQESHSPGEWFFCSQETAEKTKKAITIAPPKKLLADTPPKRQQQPKPKAPTEVERKTPASTPPPANRWKNRLQQLYPQLTASPNTTTLPPSSRWVLFYCCQNSEEMTLAQQFTQAVSNRLAPLAPFRFPPQKQEGLLFLQTHPPSLLLIDRTALKEEATFAHNIHVDGSGHGTWQNIPLLLLPPFASLLKNPSEKKRIWNTLQTLCHA